MLFNKTFQQRLRDQMSNKKANWIWTSSRIAGYFDRHYRLFAFEIRSATQNSCHITCYRIFNNTTYDT